MNGTGTTNLAAGSIGSIEPPNDSQVTLDQRPLANHGDLSWSSGAISALNGAQMTNDGALHANSEATSGIHSSAGTPAQLTSSGTLDKTTGSGTSRINVQFENNGAVTADRASSTSAAAARPR